MVLDRGMPWLYGPVERDPLTHGARAHRAAAPRDHAAPRSGDARGAVPAARHRPRARPRRPGGRRPARCFGTVRGPAPTTSPAHLVGPQPAHPVVRRAARAARSAPTLARATEKILDPDPVRRGRGAGPGARPSGALLPARGLAVVTVLQKIARRMSARCRSRAGAQLVLWALVVLDVMVVAWMLSAGEWLDRTASGRHARRASPGGVVARRRGLRAARLGWRC